MTDKTSSLRERLRQTAAEAMLDSAEQAMVSKGYDRATMQDIAAAAGCATGTFYLYFKNKEELFRAIVDRHAVAMFTHGRQAFDQATGPINKVQAGCAALLRYTQEHRPFFRLFFTAMPMRQRGMHQFLPGIARQQHDEYQRVELQMLRQAQSEGQLRSDFPVETLQEFMDAMSFSLVEQFIFATDPPSPEEQMRMLWGLMTGGIGLKEKA